MAKNKQKGRVLILNILFFLVIFVNIGYSQPFTQVSNEIETQQINIVYPKEQVYIYNTTITFNFDVLDYNSTKLDNTTTSCSYNVINPTGSGKSSGSLIYDSVLNYWYFTDSFNDISQYNYYIHCDNTDLDIQGFVSSYFQITPDGNIYENQNGLIAQIIFIVGLSSLLFVFGKLINNDEWGQGIKILVNMIALFILLLGAGIVSRSLYLFDYPENIINLANIVYFVLLFTIFPIILIFMVMFVKELLFFWESLRRGKVF